MYRIYKITNKKRPSEIYIGSTKLKLSIRYSCHASHNCSACYPYIQKYGKENFEITAIDYASTKEEALEKEEFWTLFFKEQGYFMYNKQAGTIPTQEMLEKLRIANTGRHPTEETRKKISEANKGKHLSEEAKQKISKKAKERFKNKENHPFFGKHLSDDAKAKISETKKKNYVKENHPFFGKHHKQETKDKIAAKARERLKDPTKNYFYGKHFCGKDSPVSKQIRCLENNKIYESCTAAAKDLNCSTSNIVRVCKGKLKHTKGFHFEYV